MGDRANIIVKSRNEQVCFYTHWMGYALPEILQAALKRGKPRWGDFQYLTRIIFCEMIKDDVLGETGYGITQVPHDGGERLLVVDVDKQTVITFYGTSIAFSTFIELAEVV